MPRQHEHVGGDRVAEQRLGETLRVEHERPVAERELQRPISAAASTLQSGLRANCSVGVSRRNNRAVLPGPSLETAFVARGDDEVAADQRVGLARGDAGRVQVARSRAIRTCAVTAPYFWLRPVRSRFELNSPSR